MPKPDRAPAPLADLNGDRPPAPDWFAAALAEPCETGAIHRDGADIAFKAWGERGAPGVVLVHGGTAHKGWWDAIGPLLARQGRRVVAPDLAGMGESGWRDAYRMGDHALDIRAAAQAGGAFEAGRPVIAGHSFGGFAALRAALDLGEAFSGAVILDSPVRPAERQRNTPPPRRGGRVYPDLPAALARFRLLPEQPCANLWLVDHIARGSLKQTEDGYTWLFDPDLWSKLAYEPREAAAIAAETKCPLAFVRGAQSSLMGSETWDHMRAAFSRSPFITVPEAEHHLLLDQPLATVAALDALIEGWARR